MLINSRVVKGQCPVCGAPNGSCNHLAQLEVPKVKTMSGKLHRDEIRPGVWVMLHEERAIELGLIKRAAPTRNKRRELPRNKARGE